MANKNANTNKKLTKAKATEYDEFFTRRQDIEAELRFYRDKFRGKTVYCNCDDPRESEFVHHLRHAATRRHKPSGKRNFHTFCRNFEDLCLKKLIATHFDPERSNYSYTLQLAGDSNGDGEITIDDLEEHELTCNGDFHSRECVELLDESDIVVTNPPCMVQIGVCRMSLSRAA